MTSTAKTPTLRMVMPIALGMALGIGLGAASLANGMFPNVTSQAVAAAGPAALAIPALGAGPGLRFERTVQGDARCWNTVRSGISEGMVCRE